MGAFLTFKGWEFYQLDVQARVEHPDYEAMRPGGLVGHGYGIVGTGLILTNLLYLLRRRFANAGLLSMRRWLDVHVFTGLTGALLIAFHSAFQFRTAIAVVTAASLGIVVMTGLLGRYLYALAPRPDVAMLDKSLGTLDSLVPDVSPRVREALRNNRPSEHDANEWLVRKLVTIPGWFTESRRRKHLVGLAIEDAPRVRILTPKEERAFRKAKLQVQKFCAQEVVAVAATSLLGSWRGLHRFLAIVMVLLVPVHIGVAWMYGYRWIWSE